MSVNTCDWCGERLGGLSRPDRRFCDATCRQAWHRDMRVLSDASDLLFELDSLLPDPRLERAAELLQRLVARD